MIASTTLGSIPAAFAPPPPPPGCPAVNALGNFLQSLDVSAYFTSDGTTATYILDTPNESPSGGVPGLIEYCVYPGTTPGPPTSIFSTSGLPSGCPFVASAITLAKFTFQRTDGNPCNIPFDGTTGIQMGTATWPTGTAPAAQTILMHINDALECDTLYGNDPGTCFVFPSDIVVTPPLCNGDPACKQVFIDEADTTNPSNVPAFTQLHIHYTYVIVNQPTNSFNMIFKVPTAKTQDINSGGGKDHFGCEQIPDPSGAPGAAGTYSTYQSTGMKLKYTLGKGTCDQSRFTLTAPTSTITLAPGQSITFTIDEITRINKGMKQEYTSCGPHFLNSGFTVKWFQNNDYLLHSFTTNPPLYVNAVCP